ncbi:tripartite tricarboxylate transporter substrate binding protein [Nonomuraea fuscirosea]|jgi:tripartite-type tricarboxylate transporter receptor subunit TctC|uniref:tripartite tricarboxylate transporter substrate binding protein n=1 Tax=Nonomuraea fuscirosea TaxID=1291556 RepID=UPI002DD85871|nr:tripartite tricarboxylate transporter substrate binding protein [Nonomuraea fuscirosea]WSA53766.1 tripartite tricarboxylate transporter substrate binding protein [Nonomuraea fuscirosea]
MSVLPAGGRGRAALPALLAAVVLVLAACGAPASQAGYPTRNVQLIVPYPAGSAIDATSRALVEIVNAEGKLGRRVQVVNREGGAGAVGTTATLSAKPDGHTIGLVPDGPLTLLPRTEKVSYDPASISVISEVTTSPVLFVVPGDSPYKSVADLVTAAKARPGTITIAEGPLNYAIPAQKFEQLTGTRFKHVKFDGDQATVTALIGDNVEVGVMQLAGGMAQLKAGKLRALAIASAEPIELAPEIKTFKQQDVALEWEAYNVVIAPKGLPADVQRKLNEVFGSAVKSPKFAEAARKLGLVVSGADGEAAKAKLAEKTAEAANLIAAK